PGLGRGRNSAPFCRMRGIRRRSSPSNVQASACQQASLLGRRSDTLLRRRVLAHPRHFGSRLINEALHRSLSLLFTHLTCPHLHEDLLYPISQIRFRLSSHGIVTPSIIIHSNTHILAEFAVLLWLLWCHSRQRGSCAIRHRLRSCELILKPLV